MNVSLTPELEAFVQARVATGLYNNASEVIREALRMLYEREKNKDIDYESFRRKAQIGYLSLENGNVSDLTIEEIAHEVKEKLKTKGIQ